MNASLLARFDAAAPVSPAKRGGGCSLTDFYAFMPTHNYIYAPTGDFWPSPSVNAQVPPQKEIDAAGNEVVDKEGKPKWISASAWLDKERYVIQMTWAPGEPTVIEDRFVSDGGWIHRSGVSCFNLYRPPIIALGDPKKAQRWIDHVRLIYPDDADHIIRWLAHRVQLPHQKINHALVLGGNQGIGKDTLVDPAKQAVGPWNVAEITPKHINGRFNGFVKSVVLRVNEASDLGDVDRFAFYEQLKIYTAAPPDVIRVDEKHRPEYAVFNVCGVIITTNHKTDGIYLPADDRRHYVAWSEAKGTDFPKDYWEGMYAWYEAEGNRHVSAYLRSLDLSGFNAKAPPPKTKAFWAIVDASRPPEDAELADALDKLGQPIATTIDAISENASLSFSDWLRDRRNNRKIPHRLEECGYEPVRNDGPKDGLWKIGGRRVAIYGRKDATLRERVTAAERLTGNR